MRHQVITTVEPGSPAPTWSAVISTTDWVSVRLIYGVYTADATAGTRFPGYRLATVDGTVLWRAGASAAPTAGQSWNMAAGWGLNEATTGAGGQQAASLDQLPHIVLPPGASVSAVVQAAGAGDAWSDVVVVADVGEEYEHLRWLAQIAEHMGQ